MGKLIKRLLSGIGVLILLLVIAAIAIPYFYKAEILAYVKEDINKNLNAEADFSDVHLSLFKSFPKFYCGLDNLSIVGKDEFEAVPLISAKQIGLNLDVMSVIRKEEDIKVHSVELYDPNVNMLILSNGKANYDIIKSDPNASTAASSEASNFKLDLEKYLVENGTFNYDDRANGIKISSKGLEHKGSGQFTATQFDLDTKTTIDQLSIVQGGVSYLSNDAIDLDLKMGIDTDAGTYTIKDNELLINALKLIIEGSVREAGTGYQMDLALAAPGNQFKELLSLIPGAYTKEFDQVNAKGSFSLAGNVKGLYDGVKNNYPDIGLKLKINDGQFQFPGMAEGLSKLFTEVNIAGNAGNADALKIDAPQFNFVINNEPFASNFSLRNVVSNPAIKGKINGKIDLGFIGKNFPIESVQQLAGFIATDLTIDANYQQLERGPLDEIMLAGTASVDNLIYDATGLPVFEMQSVDVTFSPKAIQMTNMVGKYGLSDFNGSGHLDNFLAVIIPGKTMSGKFSITSNVMDVDEIIGYDEANNTATANTDATATKAFDRFDLDLEASIKQLKYDIYPIRDFQFSGNVKPNSFEITSTKGFLGKSDFAAKGELNNIFRYLYEGGDLIGTLDFGSRLFDLNDYMSFGENNTNGQAKTIADEEDYSAVVLPERTDIKIKAKVKKLIYTDLNFTNVKGNVGIKDQIASITNTTLNGLGGTMLLDGNYDSSAEKPKFDMQYEMKKVDFGKVFNQLNTWEKLAPIGKYLEGDFNTTLKFSGNLKDGYSPDLSTISIDGFLQTLNATLRGFKPLEKAANTLNIKELKSLTIKNSKNWFEVKDGKVIVKDFDLKYKGIDMIIGGGHSLVEDMAYQIKAKIPRALIAKNKVGQLANQGLSFLEDKAAKAGFNLDQGEFLNVLLKIGGSMTNPTIKVDVLGTDGNSSIKDQVVNTVKETVTEKVNEVKEEVTVKVDNKKAELKAKMDKEIKNVMTLAEKQAKRVRDAGKKAAAEAKKLGYQNADKLVQKAGNNIFKKKAAELAANKLKKETDKKSNQIISEANKKADQVMATAKNKVADIKKRYAKL